MTKTISLSDDAYQELVALKRRGESFSDLARRAARLLRQERIMEAAGAWKRSGIDGDRILLDILEAREASSEPRVRF